MVPIATPCRAAVQEEVFPDRQLFSDEEPTPYYEPEEMPTVGDTNELRDPPVVVKETLEKPVQSIPDVPSDPAGPQPTKRPRVLTRQELKRYTCMHVEVKNVFWGGHHSFNT